MQKRTALHFSGLVASTRKASRIHSKKGLRQVGSVDTENEYDLLGKRAWRKLGPHIRRIIQPNVPSMTKAAYDRNDSIPGNSAKSKAEEINTDNQTNISRTETCHNYIRPERIEWFDKGARFIKNEAEFLDSRFEEKKLLKKDVKIS